MVDLHCHILPGIDDGARTLADAEALLRKEAAQGVEKIIFTPHFRPGTDQLEAFVQKRNNAYRAVSHHAAVLELPLELKAGAEVYFSTGLVSMDVGPLCMGDTDYILIELSTTHHPYGVHETFYKCQQNGFSPIIAHVERYPYVRKNPVWLYELVCAGNLVQINAEAVLHDRETRKFIQKLFKWNLVHFISTDTHSMKKRPPRLKEAMDIIHKDCGERAVEMLKYNAECVFAGKDVYPAEPLRPKSIMGRWM